MLITFNSHCQLAESETNLPSRTNGAKHTSAILAARNMPRGTRLVGRPERRWMEVMSDGRVSRKAACVIHSMPCNWSICSMENSRVNGAMSSKTTRQMKTTTSVMSPKMLTTN